MIDNDEKECIILEDDWWPEWIEELFDQDEPLKNVQKDFTWEFLEEEDA